MNPKVSQIPSGDFFSSSGWMLEQQKTVKGHGHFCKITHFFGNGSKCSQKGPFSPNPPSADCIAPTELECNTVWDTKLPWSKGAERVLVTKTLGTSFKGTLFLLANFIRDYLTRTTREELAVEILPLPPKALVTGVTSHVWQCCLLRSCRMFPEPASLPGGPTLSCAAGSDGSPKGHCIQEQETGITGEGWACQIFFLVEVLRASNHPAPRDFTGGRAAQSQHLGAGLLPAPPKVALLVELQVSSDLQWLQPNLVKMSGQNHSAAARQGLDAQHPAPRGIPQQALKVIAPLH